MENNTLGKRLKYQRTSKGITQEQLSDASSVGVRTIQRIEKEEVTPHLQTVKLLAIGLDVDINDLLMVDNPNEEKIQKKWLLLLHGLPLLGLVIPFVNVLLPVFLWIHKSEDNKVYDSHGRSIINFHCSIILYFIISLLLFFPLPGYNFFLTGLIVLFSLVFTILNIISSLEKGTCYYPLSISFLKNN